MGGEVSWKGGIDNWWVEVYWDCGRNWIGWGGGGEVLIEGLNCDELDKVETKNI